MQETINSIGIDIGTSTTQLVFSELTIKNQASSYHVPHLDIVEKKVVYRSPIYFTPLVDDRTIDAEAVKRIVLAEYDASGYRPADLKTGAVIITGETARKKNANEVLAALSDMAGDFVVATAGPDLESVLAARGAGADELSKINRTTVANIDIGGGTSNIAIYQKGKLMGTCCLDIGGRLVKIAQGRITYVYPKIAKLAASVGINLRVGDVADPRLLLKVCRLMAAQIAMALHLIEPCAMHKGLYTNDGTGLPASPRALALTYSGGVADCIYHVMDTDPFRYGDMGVLLGQAIRENRDLRFLKLYEAKETIRATVVGAGTHATDVTGSTIRYDKSCLPMKNIPVLKLTEKEEETPEDLKAAIQTRIPLFYDGGRLKQPIAIGLSGKEYRTFYKIQQLAEGVLAGANEIVNSSFPLILVIEQDIGKVLGNAITYKTQGKKALICIDGIHTGGDDYIDIGEPVAGGQVLPVVNKTLVFNA